MQFYHIIIIEGKWLLHLFSNILKIEWLKDYLCTKSRSVLIFYKTYLCVGICNHLYPNLYKYCTKSLDYMFCTSIVFQSPVKSSFFSKKYTVFNLFVVCWNWTEHSYLKYRLNPNHVEILSHLIHAGGGGHYWPTDVKSHIILLLPLQVMLWRDICSLFFFSHNFKYISLKSFRNIIFN